MFRIETEECQFPSNGAVVETLLDNEGNCHRSTKRRPCPVRRQWVSPFPRQESGRAKRGSSFLGGSAKPGPLFFYHNPLSVGKRRPIILLGGRVRLTGRSRARCNRRRILCRLAQATRRATSWARRIWLQARLKVRSSSRSSKTS